MAVTIPPYLKPGDAIGIVCPAGYMPFEKMSACIETLISWGFRVVTGKTAGSQYNYFSATDEERLNDLQRMMDDDDIKAVFCARGGYGTGRIIERISFKSIKKNPKWIIGFSDVTILQSHLFANYKIASLHAPMAAAFDNGENTNLFIQSLHDAVIGRKADYTTNGNILNKKGKATGTLVGGNLTLLAHLIGTSSDIKTKNKILFIEDVGEYVYNVDRMMHQLRRSGKFDKLAGLIVGKFTEMKDTEIPFGQSVEDVIKGVIRDYDFPVCFGFPVSHDKENYALKIGVEYKLNVSSTQVELKEL